MVVVKVVSKVVFLLITPEPLVTLTMYLMMIPLVISGACHDTVMDSGVVAVAVRFAGASGTTIKSDFDHDLQPNNCIVTYHLQLWLHSGDQMKLPLLHQCWLRWCTRML